MKTKQNWILLLIIILSCFGALLLVYSISRNKLPIETVSASSVDFLNIKVSLRQYQSEFDTLPKGNTDAIVRALSGENPKKIRFVKFPKHEGKDVFLDSWRNPYEIAILQDETLKLQSSGPNSVFGDDDDITRVDSIAE